MTDDPIKKAKALRERIEAARLGPGERRAKSLRAGLLDVLCHYDLPPEVMEAASDVLGVPLVAAPDGSKRPQERERAIRAEMFARLFDGHPEPGKFALTPTEMQRRAGVGWSTAKAWQTRVDFAEAVEDRIDALIEGARAVADSGDPNADPAEVDRQGQEVAETLAAEAGAGIWDPNADPDWKLLEDAPVRRLRMWGPIAPHSTPISN